MTPAQDRTADNAGPFDPRRHAIVPLPVARPTAVVSIDVEPDYNSTATAALEALPRAVAAFTTLGVPVTAFIEGRLLETSPRIVAMLRDMGADLALHCHDHTQPNDTPESLRQGVAAFHRAVGRPPAGYRANTFRLTEALFDTLKEQGIAWDSSILPGVALGGNRTWTLGQAGGYRIDDAVTEFPLPTWGRLPLPISQSYRNLVGGWAEAVLRRTCTLPPLLVYDMHMVDLVHAPESLRGSPLPPMVKALMGLCWRGGRRDSFDSLAGFIAFLRARGYRFATLSQLHAELGSPA